MYDHDGGSSRPERDEVGGVLACALDRAGPGKRSNRERQRLEDPLRPLPHFAHELERPLRVGDRCLGLVASEPDASAVTVNRRLGGVRCARFALGDEGVREPEPPTQARRSVDDISRGHALAAVGSRVDSDQRLAGGDADAYLELAILGFPLADRKRCPHGALGIVLVRDRRAEERHDGVADELLDRAPKVLEVSTHALVVPGEERAHVLWVHALTSPLT